LSEKKTEILNIESQSKSVIKYLKNLKQDNTEKKDVILYRGQEGIKQLLWNILTSGEKELLGFSPGKLEDITDRDFAEKFRFEFRKRKMTNRIILNTHVKMDWSNVKDFLKENVSAKTLEAEKIRFEREVFIYGDTLAVVSKKDDPEQYGIVISDKLLVDSYRQIFEFLWGSVAKGWKT